MWEEHCLAQVETTDVHLNGGWNGVTGAQALYCAPNQVGEAILLQTWTRVLANDLGFGACTYMLQIQWQIQTLTIVLLQCMR